MTYTPVYRARRRRRDWRPAAGLLVLSLGLAALVSVATVPPQPAPPPPRPPAVGDLLHAGRHSALVLGVVIHDGATLAAVRFVRGPWVGTAAYRVRGCPDGGELVNLATGSLRSWDRGEPGIFDAVGAAACGLPLPAVGVLT